MEYTCKQCETEDVYDQRLADDQLAWAQRDREYEQANGLTLTPWTWANLGTGLIATYDCGSVSVCLRDDY